MGDGGTGNLEDEKEMLPDSEAESIIEKAWHAVNIVWNHGMNKIDEMLTSTTPDEPESTYGVTGIFNVDERNQLDQLEEELRKK